MHYIENYLHKSAIRMFYEYHAMLVLLVMTIDPLYMFRGLHDNDWIWNRSKQLQHISGRLL